MILTASAIQKAVQSGTIEIDPFDPSQLNPNSYNMRLGGQLAAYLPNGPVPDEYLADGPTWDVVFRSRFREGKSLPPATLAWGDKNPVLRLDIPKEGVVIHPHKLYLGYTQERTASNHYVPILDGRSSGARLGIAVHITGGFGDLGFNGNWTLEIRVVEPVRIYADSCICQIRFEVPEGPTDLLYKGKYQNQEARPVASRLYKEHEYYAINGDTKTEDQKENESEDPGEGPSAKE